MKNIDLETLHMRYKREIKTFVSLCGIKEIDQIIRACRLKPEHIFYSKTKPKIEYSWVDEFDKVLSWRDRKLIIDNKSEEVKTISEVSTDLYYGRSIVEIIKLSKLISILGDFIMLNGKDEYLRCFNRDTFKQVSPLSIGLENLIGEIRRPQEGYKLPNIEIEKVIIKEMENINAKR